MVNTSPKNSAMSDQQASKVAGNSTTKHMLLSRALLSGIRQPYLEVLFDMSWIGARHAAKFMAGMFINLMLIALWCQVPTIATATDGAAVSQNPVTIGVNKYDLFAQYNGTASGGDGGTAYRRVTRAMAKKSLDDAMDAGVRYMRVSMSGRTSAVPGDGRDSVELWRKNPEAFWRQVDEMMDDLDAHDMQIVPVLAWGSGKFPWMVGEPLGEMFRNPDSASWRLLARFVTEFVNRYRHRRTVLFYELTNELNNYADLDWVRRCRKKDTCTEGDRFTTQDMIDYTRRLANLIHGLDSERMVSSGFSIPRGSAEHLRANPEWMTSRTDWRPDSREQFAKNLKDIHAGVDIISIHLYGGKGNRRFGSDDVLDLLVEAKRVADEAEKPLYVGEFGDSDPGHANEHSYAIRMMDKLIELGVPYSTIWVWEFYQNKTYATHDNRHTAYSLEPGYTDRLIGRLKTVNRRNAMGDTIKPDTQPPRVVLTWPLECAVVSKPMDIFAVASDESGHVKSVQFLLDGKMFAEDDSPPFRGRFSPAGQGAGKHRLTARALDNAGNTADFNSAVILGKRDDTLSCALSPE